MVSYINSNSYATTVTSEKCISKIQKLYQSLVLKVETE